ncbi:MAG: glycosyl transferase group 1 [uncultured bacterium]|nr:MAG: glycosyl transferase group 1 [uncultured bacterium]
MQSPTRIVHIIPTFSSGGAERLVLEYAVHLDHKEYDVSVASCVEDGELRPLVEKTGVDVCVGSRKLHGGRIGALRFVWKFLLQQKPDILHSHLISSDVFAFLYTRFYRQTRWVTTLHNVEHNRPWWYHIVWRFILKKADKIIAVSPVVASYAEKTFGLSSDDVQIVLNGIDLERWEPVAQVPVLQNSTMQIATIGRFEEQKGHTYLFDALVQIKDLDWQYHIFGDGSLRDVLEKKAKDLGIDERIIWHGVVSTLPDQLMKIDIVVQPSLWEGLSLTVMEAMAAGKILVTTDPAAEGLAKDKKTAYIVPVAHSDSLAIALRRIYTHKEEASTIATEGRSYAKNHFSFDAHLEALTAVYHSL